MEYRLILRALSTGLMLVRQIILLKNALTDPECLDSAVTILETRDPEKNVDMLHNLFMDKDTCDKNE